MKQLCLCIGLVGPLVCGLAGWAEEGWDGRRIEALALQLEDDEYQRREDASRKLAQAPADVLPIIERLARETDDPEVGVRLHAAAQAIFKNRVVQLLPEWRKGRGFLGIRWTIDPGQPGVIIHEVLADTAADRAGLKQNDLILSTNGKPFHEGMSQEDAMLRWRQMLPGDRLKLVIKRPDAKEPVKMEVVVGTMPAEYQVMPSEAEKVDRLWTRYREGRLQLAKDGKTNGKRLQSWPKVLETPAK